MSEDRTYAAAGVSLATAEGIVERLRAAAESTGARGFGAFAGLHPLDEHRLLAASTDSIGTKPMVARHRGALRACGADMAAHCINDVITCGADPLILLDYVAANHVDLEQVAELVEGAAEVCRAAGVALIGGETAELPGVYREDELDFAATCVGHRRARPADRRLGRVRGRLRDRPALGGHSRQRVHARSVGAGGGGLRRRRICWRRRGSISTTFGACAGPPTPSLTSRAAGSKAISSRVVPDGLRAELDWDAWERPPVFAWLAGHVEEDEARRVFNLGIGYCAVVPEPGDDLVIGRIVES